MSLESQALVRALTELFPDQQDAFAKLSSKDLLAYTDEHLTDDQVAILQVRFWEIMTSGELIEDH